MSHKNSIYIIMFVASTILFSFYGINRSIWLDEALVPLFVSEGLGATIETLRSDSHPPLYHFLVFIWIKSFGNNEITLRSLSGLFYALSILVIYLNVRSLYDEETGRITAFIYMLSPLAIEYAQHVRPYALLGLISTLSSCYFVKYFIRHSQVKKDLALYMLFNVIGTFTHYWFAFVLISHFISMTLQCNPMKSLPKYFTVALISVFPFFILWFPVLQQQLGLNSTSWISEPGLYEIYKTFFKYYYHPLFYVVLLTSIFIFSNKKMRIPEMNSYNTKSYKKLFFKDENIVWIYILFGSLLVPFFISLAKPIYLSRCTIIGLFPFAMALSLILKNINFGNKMVFLLYTLLICSVIGFFVDINNKSFPYKIPNRATAQYLCQNAERNDIVIFTHLSRAAIEYYLKQFNCYAKYNVISFPSEAERHLGWINEDKLMEEKSKLINEAKGLSQKLHEHLSHNNKIWLFYDDRSKTAKIIRNEIGLIFDKKSTKYIDNAPFYGSIITYVK